MKRKSTPTIFKKDKETITPTLKVQPRSPVIQHFSPALPASPPGSNPSIGSPPSSPASAGSNPRKPFNIKRAVCFKDPRNECDSQRKLLSSSSRTGNTNLINELLRGKPASMKLTSPPHQSDKS